MTTMDQSRVSTSRPAPRTPDVSLRGVARRFGDVVALDGVDLTLGPGEVVGFVGPNGSGKTTTVRVLLGLLRPTSGRATVRGWDCWQQSQQVHHLVGYVPAEPGLDPRLTGWQVMRRSRRLRGGTDDGRAEEVARRLDLDLGVRVGDASRGTRQKLAVVLALAHRPAVLLLDEPTTGLDPVSQREFHRLVGEQTAAGGSALLCSHVLSEVEQTADRVVVLRAGQVVAEGTPAQLRARSPFRVRARLGTSMPYELLRDLPGAADVRVEGDWVQCAVPPAALPALCARLAEHGVLDLECGQDDLEQSVLAWYREHR
ncbi:ABC transporter ATP-binding protein [Klenkia sp. LSe6-5]|uniref:ABC transporter ATP-binding protein n=1 Tax=Klenkia sesuvii TaxID=3103137 RepID=A0ABU8DVS2_9ACTN